MLRSAVESSSSNNAGSCRKDRAGHFDGGAERKLGFLIRYVGGDSGDSPKTSRPAQTIAADGPWLGLYVAVIRNMLYLAYKCWSVKGSREATMHFADHVAKAARAIFASIA